MNTVIYANKMSEKSMNEVSVQFLNICKLSKCTIYEPMQIKQVQN